MPDIDKHLEEQYKREQSNDFFANVVFQGKTAEDAIEEGYTSEDFSLQPKEAYWEKESFRENMEANGIDREKWDQLYQNTVEEYNKFHTQSEQTYEGLVNQDTKELVDESQTTTDWQHFNETLTPQEQANTVGYWNEETEEYERVDSSIDYWLGKHGTLKVAESETKKPGMALTHLEKLEPGEAPEYDDMVMKGVNFGAFEDTFMNPDRATEGIAGYGTRTVLKTAAYFTPYLGQALVAKDIIQGATGLARTGIRAAGGDTSKVNKVGNFWKRTEVGMGRSESPWSLQSIVENVGQGLQQVAGMKAAFTGTSKLVSGRAVKKADDLTTAAKGLAKNSDEVKAAVKATEKAQKLSKAGAKAGQFMGRFSMAAPASQDVALLAEHYDIDPKHVAALHAMTFTGYMGLAGISEKFFLPKAEANTVARSATQRILHQIGKKFTGKSFKSLKQTKNLGNLIVQNSKATMAQMAKLRTQAPNLYRVALGAMREGVEEVSETAMEAGIKQGYNAWQKDKAPKEGRFDDFDRDAFIREAGIAFFYGSTIGGALGTRLGRTLMGQRSYDDNMKGVQAAQDDEISAQMDKIAAADGHPRFGSKTLSIKMDENNNFLPVNKDSSDPLEQISQNKYRQGIFQTEWSRLKSLAAIHKVSKTSPHTDEAWEQRFTELENDSREKKVASLVAQLEEQRGKLDKQKKETADETTNTQKEEIEANIKKIEEDLLALQSFDDVNYAKETLYNYSPSINVDSEGNKIPETDEENFISFNKFQELTEQYDGAVQEILKQNKEDLKSAVTEIKSTNVADAMQEIGDNPITTEVREQITGLMNQELATLKEQYKDTILNELKTRKDKNGQTIAKKYNKPVDEIYEKEFSELVEDAPTSEELAGETEDLAFPFNFSPVDSIVSKQRQLATDKKKLKQAKEIESLTDITAKQKALIHDANGRPVDNQIIEEEGIYNQNPDEYVSERPLRLIAELSKHQRYMETAHTYNALVSRYNEIHDRPFLSEEEVAKERQVYDKLLDKVGNMYSRLQKLAMTSQSNRYDPIETLENSSNEALNRNAKRLQSMVARVFRDPKYSDNKNESTKEQPLGKEALQVKLNELVEDKETSFEERRRQFYEVEQAIYDFFNGLSEQEQVDFLDEVFAGAPAIKYREDSENLRMFMSITAVSPKEFAKYLSEATENLEDSAPLYRQEIAIRDVFSFLKATSFKNTMYQDAYKKMAEAMKKDEVLEFAQFIQGARGAGKTTYITSMAVNMLNSYVKNEGTNLSAYDTIIAGGPTNNQQQNLKESFTSQNLNVSDQIGVNGDQLIEDLHKDAEYLKTTGVVVSYDEATWLSEDQLKKINKAIKGFNERNRQGSAIPLQILYIGDPRQMGYIEMRENSYRESNIGTYPSVFKTAYIDMSLRSKNVELQSLMDGHILTRVPPEVEQYTYAHNQALKENQEFKGEWSKNSETGKYEGVRIINPKTDPEVVKQVAQELQDAGQSFAYITETAKEDLPEVLRKYAYTPAEMEILLKQAYTLKGVQGNEFSAVIIDLDESTMQHSGGNITKEERSLKALGVAVGRAADYAVVVNTTNRKWTSKGVDYNIPYTFNLLDGEIVQKITPERREHLRMWSEEINGETTKRTIQINNKPLILSTPITSIEALQGHVDEAFQQYLDKDEAFKTEVDKINKDLEEVLTELEDKEDANYIADDDARNKEIKLAKKSAQKEIDTLLKLKTDEFNKALNEEWAPIKEQIDQYSNQDASNLSETKQGEKKQEYATTIINNIKEGTLLASIPDIETLIIDSIKFEEKQPGKTNPPKKEGSGQNNDLQKLNVEDYVPLEQEPKTIEEKQEDVVNRRQISRDNIQEEEAGYSSPFIASDGTVTTQYANTAEEVGQQIDELYRQEYEEFKKELEQDGKTSGNSKTPDTNPVDVVFPKDQRSNHRFTIYPDRPKGQQVVYSKTGKPVTERLAELARLESGKIAFKEVTLDNDQSYAVILDKKGNIKKVVNNTKKPNGAYTKSAGNILDLANNTELVAKIQEQLPNAKSQSSSNGTSNIFNPPNEKYIEVNSIPKTTETKYHLRVYPKSRKVVDEDTGDLVSDKIARLAYLQAGVVDSTIVQLKDGRRYAVVLDPKTQKIRKVVDVSMENKVLSDNAGELVSPEDVEMKEIVKKLNQKLKGEKSNSNKKTNKSIPIFTWLTNDFGGTRTPKELFNLKQEIMENPQDYKFYLRTGDITEVEDKGTPIKHPEELANKAGRVAYIQAVHADGTRIVFGVLPYVSMERRQKNEIYELTENLIKDERFEGLDISTTVREQLIPTIQSNNSRLHAPKNEPNQPYHKLLETHKQDKYPDIRFSKQLFIYLDKKSTFNLRNGQPFAFQAPTRISQEDFDKQVRMFARGDRSLEQMKSRGIMAVPLNYTKFPDFTSLVTKYGALADNGYKVNGQDLLSKYSSISVIRSLVKAYNENTDLTQEQRNMIRQVLDSTYIQKYQFEVSPEIDVDGNIALIYTDKNNNTKTIPNLLSDNPDVMNEGFKGINTVKIDLVEVYETVVSKLDSKDQETLNSIIEKSVSPITKQPAFQNSAGKHGIMVNTRYENTNHPKNNSGSSEIISPIVPVNENENALLEDENVLSLYETNIKSISVPNGSLSPESINSIMEQVQKNRSQKAVKQQKNEERAKKEARKQENFELLRHQIYNQLNSNDLTINDYQLMKEEIQGTHLADSDKNTLLNAVQHKIDTLPTTQPTVQTGVYWKETITTLLDSNPDRIKTEDKESGKQQILQYMEEYLNLDKQEMDRNDRFDRQEEIEDAIEGELFDGSFKEFIDLTDDKNC